MNKKKKHILVTLEITDGEHRYYNKTVHEVASIDDIAAFADNKAKAWYEDSSGKPDGEAGDGGYYFEAGCLFAKVERVRIITKEEYAIMVKYL